MKVKLKKNRELIINEVVEILGMDRNQAEKLLINLRFDKDKVLNSVFDDTLPEEVKESEEEKFNPSADSYLCPV